MKYYRATDEFGPDPLYFRIEDDGSVFGLHDRMGWIPQSESLFSAWLPQNEADLIDLYTDEWSTIELIPESEVPSGSVPQA